MRVVMVLAREWQDSGRTQALDVGQTYELPDVVGAALIAAGAAAVHPGEDRVLMPPETKPLVPPKTKGARRQS